MGSDSRNPRYPGLNRREFLKRSLIASSALAAPYLIIPSRTRAQSPLTVTCWGGSYRRAIEDTWAGPFTKETGIPVRLVDNAGLAKAKAQVATGNVQWDVFDGVGSQILSGSKEGLWEPLTDGVVNANDMIQPAGKDFVPHTAYGGVIAWDAKRHPAGKHPTTFKELWDHEQYPGRIGFRTRISEILEIALLADGVEPLSLYPLDVERGFKALERIKPHVKKWIETTPQTVQLLINNEVDFTYTYISRVLPARESGATIDMSLEQTINALTYMAVMKGAPNRDAAMRYISFCMRPDRQAAFGERTKSFVPMSREGYELVSAEARELMPNIDDPKNVFINDAWWADNFSALQQRFTEWLLT